MRVSYTFTEDELDVLTRALSYHIAEHQVDAFNDRLRYRLNEMFTAELSLRRAFIEKQIQPMIEAMKA